MVLEKAGSLAQKTFKIISNLIRIRENKLLIFASAFTERQLTQG